MQNTNIGKSTKMFKRASAFFAVSMLFGASAAHSADFKFDFTATGSFVNWQTKPTPADVVSGSFIFSAPSLYDAPTSIKSVSLVLDGHNYSASEIGIVDFSNGAWLTGAALNGADTAVWGTNDFYFTTYAGQLAGWFAYTSSAHPDEIWNSTSFSQTYTLLAAVPEADTYGMLLAGLGVVCLRARRRKLT